MSRHPDGTWQPPVKKLLISYLIKHPGWISSTELRHQLKLGQKTTHWAATELVEEGEILVRKGGPGPKPAYYKYRD